MANARKGEIRIELDRPLTLRFNNYSRALFEQEYGASFRIFYQRFMVAIRRQTGQTFGKDIDKILDGVQGEFRDTLDVMILLRAALVPLMGEGLTLEDVGALMEHENVPGETSNAKAQYITGKMLDLVMAQMADVTEDEIEEAKSEGKKILAELQIDPEVSTKNGESSTSSPSESSASIQTPSGT